MTNYLIDFNIAGFAFYDGVDIFRQLKIGTELQLVPEPDNRYDPHAVALILKGHKLGFIPRSQNKFISKLLYFGHEIFTAKINRITPDEHPNNQIGVVVKIKKVINK